jgi:hypothetical protein
MNIRGLKAKALIAYPAISLLILALGATALLATGASNLNDFEFLKFTAFSAICGIAALGTSISIEHQTTKGLSEKKNLGKITLANLLRSPLKKTISVVVIVSMAVRLLETFNRADIYGNIYVPLGTYLILTFVFSALRGWASVLHSTTHLSNANALAGLGALFFPLLFLSFLDPLNAYIWGFSISFVGAILYLAVCLHANNRKTEFDASDLTPAKEIDSRLTWSYQGLTVAYLGSTLVISSVHTPTQELAAAQAQLYLAGAKAVPQVLLGLVSIALAYMVKQELKNKKSFIGRWVAGAITTSFFFAVAAYFLMPGIILFLTGNKLSLDSDLITIIFLSMLMLSVSLALLPKFIHSGRYDLIGIVWWSAGLVIAIGFLPFFPKDLPTGILLVLTSSCVSLFLSLLLVTKKDLENRNKANVL